MDPSVMMLSSQLAEVTVRNTASIVYSRITAARARKADKETIAELEQVIQDLISDKNDLVQIAQALQDEVTGQRIAKSDVEYMTGNLIPILRDLAAAGNEGDASEIDSMLEALKSLLSVETINILQLVGFNFKRAIGEPLTQLVARLISSQAPPDSAQNDELRVLEMRREIAYLEVAQNPEAYERLKGPTRG
jgi:DNA polymerase I-like protein with 3'-5' exonuclease and polymerase domains